jgi:hypothetical protein
MCKTFRRHKIICGIPGAGGIPGTQHIFLLKKAVLFAGGKNTAVPLILKLIKAEALRFIHPTAFTSPAFMTKTFPMAAPKR